MTRFDADLHRLASQLATMAAAPAITAAADDIDLVNRARRTLRNCCRTMLTDLAPPGQSDVDGQPRLADLALNPVGVLHTLLQRNPAALRLSPPARTAAHVTETANDHWERLGDAAEIVTHEWASSDPASRPTGEHAWTRIADVAALAQAAATLDGHLVEADTVAPKLLGASVEIGLAADHARRYATSGPLPQPEPLRPEPHHLVPTPVRQLRDVPAGITQLATLVTTAGHLRPDIIGALVTAHARTLDTLAAALTATSPPAHRAGRRRFAGALRGHGQSLATVRLACRNLASLDPDDPRPAAQMREIRGALRPLADKPDLASDVGHQKALLAALRPALAVTLAVDAAAGSHLRSGRWYMPAEGQLLRWAKVSNDHPINDALDLAATHARALISQLPPPHPSGPQYRRPHEILAPPVIHHGQPRSSQNIVPPAL
jgi:hypothetical protein